MKVTKRENVRPFDIDCTLIYPNAPGNEEMPSIYVFDPVDKQHIQLKYNPNMVRLLKEEHQRGSYVIVWSRSGWEWARNCIQALELETHVDRVMSKPIAYFDDCEVSEWLKDRVYIAPDVVYKR